MAVQHMSKPVVWLAIAAMIMAIVCPKPSAANPSDEELRQLLEKGLSIHEIDRELKRLEERQTATRSELRKTQADIEKQEEVVAAVREQSGEVLRAYYMGERDSVAMLFFSAGSFQELLMVWDFAEAIFQSDRNKLSKHQQALAALNEQREKFRQTELELEFLRHTLLEQRQRVLALQTELDDRLAEQAEAQAVLAQISSLIEEWDLVGLPMFNRYMNALAKAMENLPTFVQNHPDHLKKGKGSTVSFYMTDDELNQFLQDDDPMFQNLRFTFTDGKLQAFGQEDDTMISMSGHYAIRDEPENHIRFMLERIAYNGFELPDTTAQDLEQRYNLGFYPQQLMNGVTITDVQIESGMLKIHMQIKVSLWF